MAKSALPSIAELHNRLRHCPESGRLFWRFSADMPTCWNARFAGKEAFTSINNRGYKRGKITGRGFLAHRVIWAMHYGEWPELDIDHIDHNPLNNSIINLREVCAQENARNQSLRINNQSGANGVHWDKEKSLWRARSVVNGRSVHTGFFDSLEAAKSAQKKAEARHGFHCGHGRRRSA